MNESNVHIAADEIGTVTVSVNKTVSVVLSPEMVDAIIAIRKKAKMKKCWIDRPIPPYFWEDYNGDKRGKARKAKVQAPTRDAGD